MPSRSLLSFVAACVLCGGAGTAAAQPGESAWLVQVSGAIQSNAARYVDWYSAPGTAPPVISESAVNGFRGPSVGVDAWCEYRLLDRFSVGVAAAFVPTPLEATVHRGTETTGPLIADPEPSILFTPLRVTASYDLLRRDRWRFRAGGQVGLGLYRPTDAPLEFGRSRHFLGGPEPAFGGHVDVRFTGASGWGATIGFQYLRTSLNVEELGTGALPQSLTHESFTLLIGVHRLLGRRR